MRGCPVPDAANVATAVPARTASAAEVVLRVAGLRKLYGKNEVVRGLS